MEDNPMEAITNNVARHTQRRATARWPGVERLVMISTDKAVAPPNMMGASKRLAEMIVRHAARA